MMSIQKLHLVQNTTARLLQNRRTLDLFLNFYTVYFHLMCPPQSSEQHTWFFYQLYPYNQICEVG